jgi:3alpha(or 20beta)-hydroxysteroid dehydrogenase
MISYQGLDGGVVVVTGAARGQGAAEVRLLAAVGARVVATDIVNESPEALAGLDIRYRRLDVTDEAGWRGLAAELADELGGAPLKGLVNNAGITHRARLGDLDRVDWDRVIAVNLTGPMLGMQALAPLMSAGSAIVNVGSSAAVTAHYPVAYTASKWGLRGLSQVAAMEYGPRGIRVNLVHPGFIDTPMTAGAPDAMRTAQLELTPLERVGTSDEVAHAVTFLLSDAASYISGAELPVDGAFTAVSGGKLIADRIAASAPTSDQH